MKSHGKSKAVLSAIIFEVNLLQSSRFGDALRVVQDHLDAKNYYAFNPALDIRPPDTWRRPTLSTADLCRAATPQLSEQDSD